MVAEIHQNTDYACTVEQLYFALTSDTYWKDRVAEAGLGSEVIDFSVAGERTTSVVDQAVDADAMPKALHRFAGSRMTARCTEWWDALADGRARGGYELKVARVPIVVAGAVDMVSTSATTCRLHFAGTVEATIPVMGSVVEKIMLGEIDRGFTVEREFTQSWLAGRNG